MQVRYQTAPRSDTIVLIGKRLRPGTRRACRRIIRCFTRLALSAPQHFHQLFEFGPHLLDDLLTLRDISTRFLAGELVACTADGEPLVVQQAPDLANDDHVLAL